MKCCYSLGNTCYRHGGQTRVSQALWVLRCFPVYITKQNIFFDFYSALWYREICIKFNENFTIHIAEFCSTKYSILPQVIIQFEPSLAWFKYLSLEGSALFNIAFINASNSKSRENAGKQAPWAMTEDFIQKPKILKILNTSNLTAAWTCITNLK